jgi:hypothetical protein
MPMAIYGRLEQAVCFSMHISQKHVALLLSRKIRKTCGCFFGAS